MEYAVTQKTWLMLATLTLVIALGACDNTPEGLDDESPEQALQKENEEKQRQR